MNLIQDLILNTKAMFALINLTSDSGFSLEDPVTLLILLLIFVVIGYFFMGFLNIISINRSTLFLLLGYLVSSFILTLAFYFSFGLFALFGAIYGSVNLFIFSLSMVGFPQLILIPLFFKFYKRDMKK